MSALGRNDIGGAGEKIAANYLVKSGYKVLDLNYFNSCGYRIGEIDIIAEEKKNGQLVFFEIKSRVGHPDWTLPETNITPNKLRKIFKTVNYFLQKENMLERYWRLDLITVIFDINTHKAQLRHIKAIHF